MLFDVIVLAPCDLSPQRRSMHHNYAVNATFVDDGAKRIHAMLHVHSFSRPNGIRTASSRHMKYRISE
jgi:hypothetical protein